VEKSIRNLQNHSFTRYQSEKYIRLCVSLPIWLVCRYTKACGCAPAVVTKYQKRISGPLLDRIDIHIEVPRVDYEKLKDD
jgi:hypothetical protein